MNNSLKSVIVERLCYTTLVYNRINSKLGISFSNEEIEKFISHTIKQTNEADILKQGKNYYVYNYVEGIRITINSHTYRVITVDKITENVPNNTNDRNSYSITEMFGSNLAELLSQKILAVYPKFDAENFVLKAENQVIGKTYTQRIALFCNIN